MSAVRRAGGEGVHEVVVAACEGAGHAYRADVAQPALPDVQSLAVRGLRDANWPRHPTTPGQVLRVRLPGGEICPSGAITGTRSRGSR
jgi:hypothetical protein